MVHKREDLFEKHKDYCEGVKGKPTNIEMREQGKNIVKFTHHHEQILSLFVIYANFETLVRWPDDCSGRSMKL